MKVKQRACSTSSSQNIRDRRQFLVDAEHLIRLRKLTTSVKLQVSQSNRVNRYGDPSNVACASLRALLLYYGLMILYPIKNTCTQTRASSVVWEIRDVSLGVVCCHCHDFSENPSQPPQATAPSPIDRAGALVRSRLSAHLRVDRSLPTSSVQHCCLN